jgi:hypothetical protein
VAENRILQARIKGRLRSSEGEKATLAEIAKRRGAKLLRTSTGVAKPDILAAPYRKLIVQRFDRSKQRESLGRPRLKPAVEVLVVRPPSLPNAITCCVFSSVKTVLTSTEGIYPRVRINS